MSLFDQHPAPYPVRVMRAYCWRVTDADTAVIEADLGFRASVTVPIRFLGINAPELSTPEGKVAKAALIPLIELKPVLLTPFRDRQSFARWMGEVQYYQPDTESWHDVGQWLVDRGLAVRI